MNYYSVVVVSLRNSFTKCFEFSNHVLAICSYIFFVLSSFFFLLFSTQKFMFTYVSANTFLDMYCFSPTHVKKKKKQNCVGKNENVCGPFVFFFFFK